MDFYEIFVRSPVNASAARILSGSSKSEEKQIGRDELIYLIARLKRKRDLLERVLMLDTPAKRWNLSDKIRRGAAPIRQEVNPRAVDEWYRTGKAMQLLIRELARRRAEQKKNPKPRGPQWTDEQRAHYKATGEEPQAVTT